MDVCFLAYHVPGTTGLTIGLTVFIFFVFFVFLQNILIGLRMLFYLNTLLAETI